MQRAPTLVRRAGKNQQVAFRKEPRFEARCAPERAVISRPLLTRALAERRNVERHKVIEKYGYVSIGGMNAS